MTQRLTQQPAKLALALFLGSESVFFFMLLVAFVIFRGVGVKEAADNLSLPTAAISTFFLLACAGSVSQAARVARATNGNARTWLAVAILLALGFMLTQGSETFQLLRHGVTISHSQFGTTFFTLTEVYAVHVVIGTCLLGVMVWKAKERETIQLAATFWLFLAAVWIAIFSVVYLWTFL